MSEGGRPPLKGFSLTWVVASARKKRLIWNRFTFPTRFCNLLGTNCHLLEHTFARGELLNTLESKLRPLTREFRIFLSVSVTMWRDSTIFFYLLHWTTDFDAVDHTIFIWPLSYKSTSGVPQGSYFGLTAVSVATHWPLCVGSFLTQGVSVWNLQVWGHLNVLQLPPTAQGRKPNANFMRMCAWIVICLFMSAMEMEGWILTWCTTFRKGKCPCVRRRDRRNFKGQANNLTFLIRNMAIANLLWVVEVSSLE